MEKEVFSSDQIDDPSDAPSEKVNKQIRVSEVEEGKESEDVTASDEEEKNLVNQECSIPSHIGSECTKLSTDTILRLAGKKFIQCPSPRSSHLSALSAEVFNSFPGISDEDKTDLELVFYLLACAEKVGEKQFENARKLLDECDKLSSRQGDPVQRLVYYFSEALREKIDNETGEKTPRNLWDDPLCELKKVLLGPNTSVQAFNCAVPFAQAAHSSGVQTILDHVSDERKIHIIDFSIRFGSHHKVLMEAVAAGRNKLSIQHLKLTAVETTKAREKLEEIGLRLISIAKSLNIPFSFETIILEDISELETSMFELHPDEAVAIYSPFFLMTMLPQPGYLERLMRVVRSMNPRVMIVIEIESNHNSPVLVDRFTEALFFYGAFFDSLEDCMKGDEGSRVNQEAFFFGMGIRNIVASEGVERFIRHVNIGVWRAFFVRFRMVELELSVEAMDNARQTREEFPCGKSCTVDFDGKCLMIGWKGAPLHSVSAWKFS